MFLLSTQCTLHTVPSSASDRVISTLFLFTKKIITVDESTLIENNEQYGLNAVSLASILLKNKKTSGLDCLNPGLVSRAACLVWALGTAPTCHWMWCSVGGWFLYKLCTVCSPVLSS